MTLFFLRRLDWALAQNEAEMDSSSLLKELTTPVSSFNARYNMSILWTAHSEPEVRPVSFSLSSISPFPLPFLCLLKMLHGPGQHLFLKSKTSENIYEPQQIPSEIPTFSFDLGFSG